MLLKSCAEQFKNKIALLIKISSPQPLPVPAPPISYLQVTTEKKLQDLEDKVVNLTSKQVFLERERDKLQCKCNIVIGNLEESGNTTDRK